MFQVSGFITCFFQISCSGFCTSSVCCCTEVLWNWGTLPWGHFYMSSERVGMVSSAAIVLITITHRVRSWTINPQDTISDLNKCSCCARSRVAKNTSAADWCSQSDMLEHVSLRNTSHTNSSPPQLPLCMPAWIPAPGLQAKRPLNRMCTLTHSRRLLCMPAPVDSSDALINRPSVPYVEPQSPPRRGRSQCMFIGHLGLRAWKFDDLHDEAPAT